jgi:hypothetical protein
MITGSGHQGGNRAIRAIEAPTMHLHLHGVSAEDVAAVLRQRGALPPGSQRQDIPSRALRRAA